MKFADLKHMGRQEKRKLIIETVLKLYAGRSFLEVRIVDVAAAIGVAPATLYNYFSGHDDLLLEASIEQMTIIGNEFAEIVKMRPPETLEAFTLAYVELMLKYETTSLLLSYCMLNFELDETVLKRLDAVTSIFVGTCHDIMQKNGLKNDVTLSSRAMIAALNGIIMMSGKRHLMNTQSKKEDAVRASLTIASNFSTRPKAQ